MKHCRRCPNMKFAQKYVEAIKYIYKDAKIFINKFNHIYVIY